MPLDSIGMEIKMSVDMDPKTYSPMSGSDENMSSPPSVLTTASAGSCTPSSLPSAGSTPSSIQSAGSTPYQFVSQEESTVIKPFTPSDHQSVHPCTPDQPVTPDQSVSSDLASSEISDLGNCKKNLMSGIDSTECVIGSNRGGGGRISEEVNERREDCPCIMCDDKQAPQNPPSQEIEVDPLEIVKSKSGKGKSPKGNGGGSSKSRKKNRQQYNKNVHYQSELSEGPESTSIKLKIKLTSTSSKHRNNLPLSIASPIATADPPPLSATPNLSAASANNSKGPKGKRSRKRKSSDMADGLTQPSPATEGTKRKRNRKKPIENFDKWGPIEQQVNGDIQSGWGYNIPRHILEKIFLLATYSTGCIPFLLRISKVCRLWREVSIEPKLWHTADLATGLIKPLYRNEKKLLWIIENRLTQVGDLNLAGWTEAISPLMLRRISELCPKIHNLNLASCYKLHAENLHSLLYSLVNLQCLDLTSVMGTHKPTPRCAVGQQTLSELAASLKDKFTHLIIANNTLSNVPSIITSLAEHCHNLEVLDLSSVETVGRDSVRLDIEKLQTGCPRLRILRLANSLFRLNLSSMTVQVSSPGFPDLEELSLAVDDRANIGMNDSELERILKNSNKLRLLDVRGCHNVTDCSLVRIPPWDLEHLFLAGGSTPRSYSDRLELVIRKWQHSLVELDLSWTSNSEAIDVALLAMAEEKNEKLRILNLCGSSMNFDPVRKLLKNCLSLQWLNLTSCRALPRGVKRLYQTSFEIDKLKASIDQGKFDDPPPDA